MLAWPIYIERARKPLNGRSSRNFFPVPSPILAAKQRSLRVQLFCAVQRGINNVTNITLERNQSWVNQGTRYDFQNVESPLPKPSAVEGCPHCQGATHASGEHSILRIKSAFRQFVSALIGLVFLLVRLVRLVMGMALSLVGTIGAVLHAAGTRIVHPADRRLLPGGRKLKG